MEPWRENKHRKMCVEKISDEYNSRLFFFLYGGWNHLELEEISRNFYGQFMFMVMMMMIIIIVTMIIIVHPFIYNIWDITNMTPNIHDDDDDDDDDDPKHDLHIPMG